MKYDIVTLQEKTFAGISTVTANDDPKVSETIGSLWEQFYSENLTEKIKGSVNSNPIGLYYDYVDSTVDNFQLKYRLLVGLEVEQNKNCNITIKTIPAGRYAKFTSSGSIENTSIKVWQEIWQINLNRTFTGDFEEYIYLDAHNIQVNIYIAIK